MSPLFEQVPDFLKKLSISKSSEENNNKKLITTLETSPDSSSSNDGVPDNYTALNADQLPLLVLINPNSGQGKAHLLWEQKSGMLGEAGITWKTIVTTHKNHARDVMEEAHLDKWSGVLVVSGDGLVHEVYNGLDAREDWSTSLKFPVGVLPAGSGNALNKNIIHRRDVNIEVPPKEDTLVPKGDDLWVKKEEYISVPECCKFKSSLVSVRGSNLTSLDLMLVKTEAGERIGFLSVGWGLISDVDIDSETLRWMGSLRFTIYGLLHIARKSIYRATLSYIPAHSKSTTTETSSSKISSFSDEDKDLMTIMSSSDKDYMKEMSSSDKDYMKEMSSSDKNYMTEMSSSDKDSNWVTESSDYLCIYVMNLPYLDQSTKLAPGARMDDGFMWLVIVRASCTRVTLLKFMMSMEAGTHTDLPGIAYFPVSGVRIRPSKEGHQAKMTIDGELIPTGAVQVHSLPQAATIMMK